MDEKTIQRPLGEKLCHEFMSGVFDCIRRALPPLAGTMKSWLSGRINNPLRLWTKTIQRPSGDTFGKELLMPLRDAPVLLTRRGATSARIAPGRVIAVGLVVLVVIYEAVLRFDALTLRFGAVQRPAWLHALQQSRGRTSAIRPAGLTWAPVTPVNGRLYVSDPYTYLKYAREMRSFYAAHRREPVFPFATKIFLWVFDQQDLAVSFASAFFSVLAVLATFLLGSYAFSYGVGLAAAAAMAVEYDVIFWGVDGGRDDAFTCAVVLFIYVVLRYVRSRSRGNAILMGATAGVACLVRITSLSFVLPVFAWLLFKRRAVNEPARRAHHLPRPPPHATARRRWHWQADCGSPGAAGSHPLR